MMTRPDVPESLAANQHNILLPKINCGRARHNEDMAAVLPVFFHRHDLANYLACSTRTVDRLDAGERIPVGRRIGSRKVWVRQEIEKWIEAGCPNRATFESLRTDRK